MVYSKVTLGEGETRVRIPTDEGVGAISHDLVEPRRSRSLTALPHEPQADVSGLRVAVVGINYAPEVTGIAPYTTAMCEDLAARGASVEVITGLPHYPEWRVHDDTGWQNSGAQARNGVTVRRVSHHVPAQMSALTRGRYEWSFLMGARHASRRVGSFDVIVAVVPALASALAARSLASRLQVPYAVIVQDLVGKAAAQSGIRGGGPVAGAVGWAERRALVDAAAVATVSRPMARTVEAYGVPSERIAYLPNYTHIDMPVISRVEARRPSVGRRTPSSLCTGNMGFKQDLDNVVAAARLNAGQGRLEFVLMGDGNQRRHLEALAAGIPGIRFIDPMSEDDYPLALAAADVLLVNERPTVDDMCLPSKLTSYLVSRRPIVAAVPPNGATAGLVDESRGGLVLPPSSPGELLNSLRALLSDPGRCEELGERGNVFAQTTLTRDRGLAATRSFVARAAEGV